MNIKCLTKGRLPAAIMIAAGLTMTLFTAPIVHAKIYKSIDANGNVQYSQIPPTTGQFTEVNPGPPPSQSADQANQQLQDTLQRQKDVEEQNEADKKKQQQDAAGQTQQQQMCDEARRRLTLYQNNTAPHLGRTQDGATHSMTEEERQSEIAKMQKILGDFCEGQ
jgi:hypothetical protein